MTRYLIIGAGAVGGTIGGRLTQAGVPTVLVARGAHLAAMQRGGLRLRTPDSDTTVPVTAVGGPEAVRLTADDVLVVSTKTHQVPELLPVWADAPLAGGGTAGGRLPVLLATNGVASEAMSLRYFDRVFGVCVWLPAVHLVPGEVVIRSAPVSGVLHVGRVPAAAPPERDLISRIEHDWTSATFDVRRPSDVMAWKHRKLISNIGNAISALVGFDDHRELVARAEAEARHVLDAAGIAYTGDADEAEARSTGLTMRPVAGVPEQTGGSTWQSLTRGTGNVETDYLNGEIALIARLHGLHAPINARLAVLARAAARRGDQPGTMSAAELDRAMAH